MAEITETPALTRTQQRALEKLAESLTRHERLSRLHRPEYADEELARMRHIWKEAVKELERGTR